MEKKTIEGFNGPVFIHVHSRRKGKTDAEGVCFKYALDAIVDAGILPSDSPEIIPENAITYSSEQVKTRDQEETVITITGNAI